MTRVDNKTVLNNSLTWQFGKKQIRARISNNSQQYGEMLEDLSNLKEWIAEEYDFDQKIYIMKFRNPNRADLIQECEWSRIKYPIQELGPVVPKFGGFPPEVITKSIPEIVEYIRNQESFEQEVEQSIDLIFQYKKVEQLLSHYPPMVIEPGSKERNLDSMERCYNHRNWDIVDTKAYIEDGNHRAIAMALTDDTKKIECFVGQYPD